MPEIASHDPLQCRRRKSPIKAIVRKMRLSGWM